MHPEGGHAMEVVASITVSDFVRASAALDVTHFHEASNRASRE